MGHDAPAGEIYRPQFHFSPPANWMNDPNGLVYYAGEYHLFYQCHPASTLWGPMHWGHAVSPDLISWQHLAIALYPDEHGDIFSGSGFIDWSNRAGFGQEAMIVCFTHHKAGRQSQSLAYSLDKGRTWHKYEGNPILDPPPHLHDFRDPKVFWYGGADGHWLMVLAAGREVFFYTSSNLIEWQISGRFGFGYGAAGGVWETPDLFQLPISGRPETRWVLTIGLGEGGPAGGSATQYFIGHFDGQTFASDNPPQTILWADFGPDYYAPQSWSDEPQGRRLMIGWMSNWRYAAMTPTTTWRGIFSLPRELSLSQTRPGLRLIQRPIGELATLRREHYQWQQLLVTPDSNLVLPVAGESLEIEAEFEFVADLDHFGLQVRVGETEQTTIGYDARQRQLYLERSWAGQTALLDHFPGRYMAHMEPMEGLIRLHIFVDRCSVELFGNGGLVTLSATIFPAPQSQGMTLFAIGEAVRVCSFTVYRLANNDYQDEH